MDTTTNSITFRIACCRRQRAMARTPIEVEAWRAEEEGLRDAVLHQDHIDQYRGSPPGILDRYLTGFQDAKALMRIEKASENRRSSAGIAA